MLIPAVLILFLPFPYSRPYSSPFILTPALAFALFHFLFHFLFLFLFLFLCSLLPSFFRFLSPQKSLIKFPLANGRQFL